MATTALLVLDLIGTFAFALNGALTALRATRLDIVGVVTLGMITALAAVTATDAAGWFAHAGYPTRQAA